MTKHRTKQIGGITDEYLKPPLSEEEIRQIRETREENLRKKEEYINSEEYKSKRQEALRPVETYLTDNSYTKLGPDATLEIGKVYYIVRSRFNDFEDDKNGNC
jgi:hypothetical protein